jgi:hypothetical protein
MYHYITDNSIVIEDAPEDTDITPINLPKSNSYSLINSLETNVKPMNIADILKPQTNIINPSINKLNFFNNSEKLVDNESKKKSVRFSSDILEDDDSEQEHKMLNPWSRIIKTKNEDYPYHFHLKINIPSLNDYTTWVQVIPNLGFDPQSGELIIPSKDEISALAIANLIAINFSGKISLTDILNKNLIPISINKARKHKIVQRKLREQIKEHIYGKTLMKENTDFEQDLAIKTQTNTDNITNDLTTMVAAPKSQSEFKDTFRHFTDQPMENNYNIDPYDGNDFSYF